MNNLKSILEENQLYIEEKDLPTNLEWKTQDSNESSILFYKASKINQEEQRKFEERLSKAKYYCCVTNLESGNLKNVHTFELQDLINLKREIADEIYPFDSHSKCLIGVTGTNGKTTTVELIRQLVLNTNLNVLTVGTLGVYQNDKCVENFSLTSPSYIDLRKALSRYAKDSHVIAMELSSHALDQQRIGKMKFDMIGWTNFTQDHLDYHETMDNYFIAKQKVFQHLKDSGRVVVSRHQEELIKKLSKKDILETTPLGKIKNIFFKPQYNLENLELAISLLKNFIDVTLESIESLTPPPGRFNIIEYKDNYIVIDYAHTPDGLESITKELKKTFKDYKLITLFGCGGDRDKTKRPLMSKAASINSDYIFLTSDNPRFELPEDIIKDAEQGISIPFEKYTDRETAITKAMQDMHKSVLLIAGKGHENYLDINGEKQPYSDEAVVRKLING